MRRAFPSNIERVWKPDIFLVGENSWDTPTTFSLDPQSYKLFHPTPYPSHQHTTHAPSAPWTPYRKYRINTFLLFEPLVWRSSMVSHRTEPNRQTENILTVRLRLRPRAVADSYWCGDQQLTEGHSRGIMETARGISDNFQFLLFIKYLSLGITIESIIPSPCWSRNPKYPRLPKRETLP